MPRSKVAPKHLPTISRTIYQPTPLDIASITPTEMSIVDIAREIRLQIYSELLVLSEPIVFVADYGPLSPPLFRSKRDGLCPALLRVNKMMYSEASTLLYSNNRFRFPEVCTSTVDSAHIAPFLRQIGSQASHIRHICIPFPTFMWTPPGSADIHSKNLDFVRETCTGIRTFELLVSPGHAYTLCNSPIAAKGLGLLDNYFNIIPSLKEIVINFEAHSEEDPSDDLTRKMHHYGWTVKVRELPKRVWYSEDDRVEFDNPEDCQAYDNEQRRIDEQKRQREEEHWLEEYYERRRDPYWKNDSDYD